MMAALSSSTLPNYRNLFEKTRPLLTEWITPLSTAPVGPKSSSFDKLSLKGLTNLAPKIKELTYKRCLVEALNLQDITRGLLAALSKDTSIEFEGSALLKRAPVKALMVTKNATAKHTQAAPDPLLEDFSLILDPNLAVENIVSYQNRSYYGLGNHFPRLLQRMVDLNAIPDEFSLTGKFLFTLYSMTKLFSQMQALIPYIIQMERLDLICTRWIPALLDPAVKKVFDELCALCPAAFIKYRGKFLSAPDQVKIGISMIASYIAFPKVSKGPFDLRQLAYYKSYASGSDFMHFLSSRAVFKVPSGVVAFGRNVELTIKYHLPLTKGEAKGYPVIEIRETAKGFSFELKAKRERESALVSAKEASKRYTPREFADFILGIGEIIELFPSLKESMDNENQVLEVDFAGFLEIFSKTLPLLTDFGVRVIYPPCLEALSKPVLQMSIQSKGEIGSDRKNFLMLQESTEIGWNIRIGKEELSLAEFQILAETQTQLCKVGKSYIEMNPTIVKPILEKLPNLPVQLSTEELMQTSLSQACDHGSVCIDAQMAQLVDKVLTYEYIPAPANLLAELRPYQQRGFNWLVQNIQTGFGSVLADDMGLGKTLQVIAAILHLKNLGVMGDKKVLIVAPMSLLSNWKKEIARFAPSLTLHTYYGLKRELEGDCDILITSYGLLRSDKKELSKKSWFLCVIDEAQNIKNPSAEQTKAVKAIVAPHKIAMTGTPVENRLLEYWSIFDFANKNYLSTAKVFQARFAIPIEKERSEDHLVRFKRVTEPFILRRLKSDKAIIADLPDKMESNGYCKLTPIQVKMYEALVNPSLKQIEGSAGIARKGLVLTLMTKLKQICNHPAMVEPSLPATIEESGKLKFLEELVSEILESDEKMIIFTQYTQMGEILAERLGERFGLSVPFFHGGLSLGKRDLITSAFQSDVAMKILVISLKAGGTGLNLTSASHVIHYDLWWNPATEAQATDRVHRIGQDHKVMVHRLVCEGTVEESIDAMVQRKKELANLAVGAGESWITELSSDELRDLVMLRYQD